MTANFDDLRLIEAILFAAPNPVDERELALRLPEGSDIEAVLSDLQVHYANRGVVLVRREGKWAFRTAEDLADRMNIERVELRKLSRAAIEVMAIIAYGQPITRAEIEEVRGVQLSKGTLDALFEAGWIRPRGRRRTPGRPMQWATTESFLDHFGLQGLEDLPDLKELKASGFLDLRADAGAYSNRAEEGEPLVDMDLGLEEEELDLGDEAE
jgi:segregation and condensation protein B